MLRLFTRFSIIQSTLISVVSLTCFSLFLATISLYTTWASLRQHIQDEKILNLMDALEKVAHHHAVERGLSAGYLGEPTESKKQNLTKQRSQADAAAASLLALVNQEWPVELQMKMHVSFINDTLNGKSSIRESVDKLSAADAFAYYSKVNQIALDTLETLRMNLRDWRIQKRLSGAINLAWYKETSGQLRGKINGILAKKQLSPTAQAEIKAYINQLDLLSHYLNTVLENQQLSDFLAILNSQNSRDIKQVHNQFVRIQDNEFNPVDFPTSSIWFTNASAQIGEIKGLLDKQWDNIHKEIKQANERAKLYLVVETIILLVIVFFIGLLNIQLIRSLRQKLQTLTHSLNTVAKEGDLTQDLRLYSQDELGTISSSVHATIHAFKLLILRLADSIQSSMRLSGEINTVSNRVLKDAKSTQQLATNIATAVEQMAATSEDIARSAALVLDASDALSKNAGRTHDVNQKSREAMSQLNNYMQIVETKAQYMEQQVGTISGILDTINSLAEQTNLLALNAAIEAARAGESGRGFAVVADEVRNLAKSSKDSSDRIAELLKELQVASGEVALAIKNNVNSTQDTLQRVEDAQQISDEMKLQSTKVESLSHQVASAAEEQSTVAREIAVDTTKVLNAATHELDSAANMMSISEALNKNNQALESTIKQFKID